MTSPHLYNILGSIDYYTNVFWINIHCSVLGIYKKKTILLLELVKMCLHKLWTRMNRTKLIGEYN